MKKIRIYLWVIYKTLCFYYKRNTPVGNALITAVVLSIGCAVVEREPFFLLVPIIIAVVIFGVKKLYFELDAFGRPDIRIEARLKQEKTVEELIKYLNESM